MSQSGHRSVIYLVVAALMLGVGATRAVASTISLGTRIPIDATTFALPVDITGAQFRCRRL